MTSTRPTFIVQPQRHARGSGWIECPEHQAQRFAVLRIERYRANGRQLTATRTLTSWRTRREAQAAADALHSQQRGRLGKLAKALARQPGDRAGPRPDAQPYARGLTEDEYRSLRP